MPLRQSIFSRAKRGRSPRAAAWCFAFFFALWPYFSAVAVSGMETSVMLALIASSAFGLDRRAAPLRQPGHVAFLA